MCKAQTLGHIKDGSRSKPHTNTQQSKHTHPMLVYSYMFHPITACRLDAPQPNNMCSERALSFTLSSCSLFSSFILPSFFSSSFSHSSYSSETWANLFSRMKLQQYCAGQCDSKEDSRKKRRPMRRGEKVRRRQERRRGKWIQWKGKWGWRVGEQKDQRKKDCVPLCSNLRTSLWCIIITILIIACIDFIRLYNGW